MCILNRFYQILYKGLEHPQTVVSYEIRAVLPCGCQGTATAMKDWNFSFERARHSQMMSKPGPFLMPTAGKVAAIGKKWTQWLWFIAQPGPKDLSLLHFCQSVCSRPASTIE